MRHANLNRIALTLPTVGRRLDPCVEVFAVWRLFRRRETRGPRRRNTARPHTHPAAGYSNTRFGGAVIDHILPVPSRQDGLVGEGCGGVYKN